MVAQGTSGLIARQGWLTPIEDTLRHALHGTWLGDPLCRSTRRCSDRLDGLESCNSNACGQGSGERRACGDESSPTRT